MIKYRIIRILLFLVACMILGCKQKPEDRVAMYLDKLVELHGRIAEADADNVHKRVEQALLQWRNGELDREPMLLYAVLGNIHKEMIQMPISLCVFDEDADLLGFGIREQYVDEKGQINTILEEEYPIYALWPQINYKGLLHIVSNSQAVVQIRNNNQRKDVKKWETYINSEQMDANDYRETWEESLPPIWVSMPVPGKREVLVYAIDRAGNKSSPIPLVPLKTVQEN